MNPTVSVITTVYNTARFLNEAIASVVGQDYTDWELILVDDGSTDGSADIALGWAFRDGRIQRITHPSEENRGISASRNLGIRRSRGSLIALLDSDDVWLPGKLARQVATLCAFPDAAMTFGAAERWHSWDAANDGANDFVVPSALPGWGADCLVPASALLQAFLADESLTPCPSTVLARRQAVTEAGAFENEFRGMYDDQVFYAKLCPAKQVYLSSECVARYRQHENSCCAIACRLGTQQKERTTFLAWLEAYRMQCAHSR